MLRVIFCSVWAVLRGFGWISLKTAQIEQNVALSIQAHCFCDYSATNKPILDFSKDSESLGRPLDDSVATVGADVRKCPKVHPRSQNVRICPNMSENVRKCPNLDFRTNSDIFGHGRAGKNKIRGILVCGCPRPIHKTYFKRA